MTLSKSKTFENLNADQNTDSKPNKSQIQLKQFNP